MPQCGLVPWQKIAYLVLALEASARGYHTLHTYQENVAILDETLILLSEANSASTSGTHGASPASTPYAVRG
jgi:hypothetical protein